MAKKAALAFVKRTMERYQEFEETGKSCFGDPLYKDIFLSGVSCLIDGQHLNSSPDDESHKLHLGASGCSLEVRTSGKCQIKFHNAHQHLFVYSLQIFFFWSSKSFSDNKFFVLWFISSSGHTTETKFKQSRYIFF